MQKREAIDLDMLSFTMFTIDWKNIYMYEHQFYMHFMHCRSDSNFVIDSVG